MKIENWFKNKDYKEGVEILKSSSSAKARIISLLERGKSNRNMALLIAELRKLKKVNLPQSKAQITSATKPKKVNLPLQDVSVQQEALRAKQKDESSSNYFKKIRYGELPPELKIRFRQLKDLFYDFCDLKYQLNDLPDELEEEALAIILKMEDLDQQRDVIWKELDHWQNFKTKLPTATDNDYSDWGPKKLYAKKASLNSSISKMNKRLKKWNEEIDLLKDKAAIKKKRQQISRTEKNLHKNKIDLQKIETLL
ncbi:hypothetical protein [Mesonia sp. HuA40]|uniref:hypothetical protein n=1 Tax=Mesonia sp. HuA40 TaxID=2602761 RepID=UPI0011C73463|nr:hypothetical protein [Mesonia sp. HuA40]TXK73944.1 hypothetical protein FT993_03535 [Mesonia sp. HuA40]